jgi:hypothetical protein
VLSSIWQGLPTDFCRKYLPKRDEFLTLVDEVDDEVESLYLALKRGLSAGWRKFSIDHELVDGDCLVFELIQRTTFKVRFLHLLHFPLFSFGAEYMQETFYPVRMDVPSHMIYAMLCSKCVCLMLQKHLCDVKLVEYMAK